MVKVPAIAKAFAGRWRIVEMDNWDNDFLDLVEEAQITFHSAADGEIVFGALRASSMSATARATARPQSSSPGKASTRTIPPRAADGSLSAPRTGWSATSISTMARNQASSVNEADFFNSLLTTKNVVREAWLSCKRCPQYSNHGATLLRSLPFDGSCAHRIFKMRRREPPTVTKGNWPHMTAPPRSGIARETNSAVS
jgi:hypothetical protein